MSEIVRKKLMDLGIPPHMTGFAFLEDAIMLWKAGDMVTKDIYPVVAKNNRTSFTAVEKGIRAVIKYAWSHKRGNLGAIYEVFGLWAFHEPPKPAEFIAGVAIWRGRADED